ncbi:MAG TPA: hypothetical protein VIO11_02815, partial [Candidatus Methanoperedens sp.]
MPDWPIHLIVPLLALLITGKKEHTKYILLFLPLSVMPDMDTFMTQHRALLHNIFIPFSIFLIGSMLKEKKILFIIASVYLLSHIVLDLFGGGVVLFYPFYDRMAFVDASLQMSRTYELIWKFDYGFGPYSNEWKNAYGYISESIGTGAILFVFLAMMICAARRNWIKEDING